MTKRELKKLMRDAAIEHIQLALDDMDMSEPSDNIGGRLVFLRELQLEAMRQSIRAYRVLCGRDRNFWPDGAPRTHGPGARAAKAARSRRPMRSPCELGFRATSPRARSAK